MPGYLGYSAFPAGVQENSRCTLVDSKDGLARHFRALLRVPGVTSMSPNSMTPPRGSISPVCHTASGDKATVSLVWV